MKDLFVGVLAVAAGIYVEKKYNVSEKVAKQVKKYTGKDLFCTEDKEPKVEVD